jgi:hypothetical protein
MSTHALDGSPTQIDLGDGYALSAPAVRGTVESTAVIPGARVRGFSGEVFDAQLEAAGLTKAREIELNATSVAPRDVGGTPPTIKLSVPNEPGGSAIVLLQDEAGALRWIVPAETSREGARAFGGDSPAVLTFDVPTATDAQPGARGFGSIGKKLLKVFKFPIEKVEDGVGKIAAGFIRRWEAKNRPNFICTYGPAEYRQANHADFQVTASDWARLSQGRALLFVHGTFSTCDAFADIPPKLMDELSARYGGRIFAFNHQTLAEDPADNAQFFLNQMPAGTHLTVDIVCHSRGGLVSREIAARGPAAGLTVGRLVMVGVPNGGTSLADKEHMVSMVNRLTTVANLFPSKAVTVTVDALVAVIKCAAHALLEELTGLKAMNPKETYIKGLNSGPAPATSLYAIISNYEPKPGEPLFSLTRAKDAGIDRIVFSGAQNDLVVPTLGGFQVDAAGFPIAPDRLFQFAPDAGVIHTDYFSQADTQARLNEWLEPAATRAFAAATARGSDLAPADFEALRPHVINLADGQFSRRGQLSSTRQDVETLFSKTLPAWLKSRPTGAPRRIVFYAHGGLINEKDGLAIANKHIQWWKDNGVFPIYFVWETGLFDALGSLLSTADRTSRGIGARGFSDLTDLVVEKACRAARGDLIWGAMKTNAERASMPAGGARVVAQELSRFCAANPGENIELHAVGHSAGSIFHAHFLTATQREKVPNFKSLQLLAPAIRVDLFKQRLMPLIDTYVDRMTMYSMTDDYERRDTCLGVYRKSLLYLIHKALERRDGEPVLGLRVSAENDPDLRALFFGDAGAPRAEAVWSVTSGATGASVSTSTTHGGFDDDGPTMSSVGLRILSPNGKPDAATVAAFRAYAGDARRGREWPLAEEVRIGIESSVRPTALSALTLPAGREATAVAAIASPRAASGGKRYALCVGIDAYPAPDTLSGCVNDTREWGRLFTETLRFDDVQFLTNTDATRQNILNGIKSLISRAQPGDTLAFQFSGHGTELPDDDGDEADGTDEAFVPVDWQASKFLVDDDLRDVLITIPDGVAMTCFIDCCHSGTITRAFGRGAPSAAPGMKARFMTMKDKDPKIVERYLAERQSQRSSGAARSFSDRSGLKWVNFSACDATERAFEQNGNGDFTRIATGLVRSGGIAGVTNVDFQRRLIESFGADRRQTPQLDCPSDAEALGLFQFFSGAGAGAARADNQSPESVGALDRRSAERRDELSAAPVAADRRSGGDRRALAQQLREIAAFIEADAT